MSEQAMPVEKVRAMLTENLERVRKASNDYFQMLEKGLSSSQLPIGDQAKHFTDLMQRNVAATFDLCDKLIKANDAQDARLRVDAARTTTCIMRPGLGTSGRA